MPALINFQDRVTVITAAWLNYVDAIAQTYTSEHTPASGPPTTGLHFADEFVKANTVTVAGPTSAPYIVRGWRCILTGTPGTWVEVHEQVMTLTNVTPSTPAPTPAPVNASAPPPPAPYSMRIQAENLTGAGAITGTPVPNYDGTGYADYQTSTATLTASFGGVVAGTYSVNIRYFNFGTQQNFVNIDGGGNVNYSMPSSGTFGVWETLTIPNVVLGSGTRTVSTVANFGFTHYDYFELVQQAAAPAPTPAPAPAVQTNALKFALGVNVHDTTATSTANNTLIAAIYQARNFSVVRLDLWGGAANALERDLITKLIALGVKVQGTIHTATEQDMTIYTGAGLTTVQSDSRTQANAIIANYVDLITDFEMFNETQLRADLTSQVAWNSQGSATTAYNSSTAAASVAARLLGVRQAIADQATSTGKALRAIMGFVGKDWGWGIWLSGTKGLTWDVTGFHIYPHVFDASLLTDTFYGTGGPLTQMQTNFGKPITINEFNAGEHFDTGYIDSPGNSGFENGLQSVTKHMLELTSSTVAIESVLFYELFDESFKDPTESQFGLMKDLNTPKVDLALAAAFAGGTLSAAEQLSITSRTALLSSAQITSFQPPFYPFGSRRNGAYPFGITVTGTTNGAMDAATTAAYDAWKNNRLTQAPPFTPTSGVYAGVQITTGYYDKFTLAQPGQVQYACVSEGMGYAMVIVAMMAGHDPNAQTIFNGLLQVVRGSPAYNEPATAGANKYLMDWRLNLDMSSAGGGYNASDGDMEVAYALLLAHKQWGSMTVNYWQEALNTIGALKAADFATNGVMWAPVQDVSRTSDYMPTHFAAFKAATNDTFWDNARTNSYALVNSIINTFSGTAKLPPDWIYQPLSATPQPSPGGKIEGPYEGIYGPNAVRTPWRWGLYYLMYGDTLWKGLASAITTEIKTVAGSSATQTSWAYSLAGVPVTSLYYEPSTDGCNMVAAMTDVAHQTWLNNLWNQISANYNVNYFAAELSLIPMIIASGNWWKPI